MSFYGSTTPLNKDAMYEWAAMGCNETTSEEFPPNHNCLLRVGCNGLQWEDF